MRLRASFPKVYHNFHIVFVVNILKTMASSQHVSKVNIIKINDDDDFDFHLSLIKLPPHLIVSSITRSAAQGNSFGSASLPPIMFVCVFCPFLIPQLFEVAVVAGGRDVSCAPCGEHELAWDVILLIQNKTELILPNTLGSFLPPIVD